MRSDRVIAHPDPYVRLAHMLLTYRRVGCHLDGEEEPFQPLSDLDTFEALEIVEEAMEELVRMGVLLRNGNGRELRGPAFPVEESCEYCDAEAAS